MNLEISSISALNKLDLVKQYGEMPMSLEYYLDGENLAYMINFGKKCKNNKKG